MFEMHAHGRITTAKMAAKWLGVSRQRVWQLVRRGALSRVDVDGTPYIGAQSLEMLLRYRAEKEARGGE